MRRRPHPPMSAAAGVALVAVLWIVAALSLLAGALAAETRGELRTVETARAFARASARGDAAIELAALELRAAPQPPTRRLVRRYAIEGHEVDVMVAPVAGFVDLNRAPETLLRDLFRYAAGTTPERAEALAQRVLDWRDPDSAALPLGAEDPAYEAAGVPYRTRGGAFESPEDLLQVLGIDFDTYERVRDLVTVFGHAAGVDPLAASGALVVVLAAGDRASAGRISAARDAGEALIDTTALTQAHLAAAAGLRYRLEARVTDGDGHAMARVRWVDLGTPAPGGLPWRTLRAEAVRAVDREG